MMIGLKYPSDLLSAKKLSQKIGSGEKISAADFEEDLSGSNALRLEGIEIEGATRKSRYKNETEDQEDETAANNDYILAKLFKNSKVHSVSKVTLASSLVGIIIQNIDILAGWCHRECVTPRSSQSSLFLARSRSYGRGS